MWVLVPLLVGASLVASWFVLRHWPFGGAFPVWLSWVFDNRFADSYSGVQTIIDRASVTSGMRVLDAGCGPGRLTIPLARRVEVSGEVVALDVQEGMLARVRARAAKLGLTNVRTLRTPLEECSNVPELQTAAFDRALLVTVLGEVPDREAALAGLHTALKPGGILSITEFIIDPDYVPHRMVVALAQRSGFERDRIFGNALMFTANFRKPERDYPVFSRDDSSLLPP